MKILLHIVFRTKRSENTIPEETKIQMFKYILAVCEDMQVKLVRINGYKNHLHLLISVGQCFDISDFVKRIKQSTSVRFQQTPSFPDFSGWAKGYAAVSVSYYEKSRIVQYISNQSEHHRHLSFQEELMQIFETHRIDNANFFLKDE